MSGGVRYPKDLEDELSAGDHRFAVVVSRFHSTLTELLLESALTCLRAHGATDDQIAVVRVPGAWELPQAALRTASAGGVQAVIALGCLIRGETPHFDIIAAEVARGLGAASHETGVPVVFGVLTTDTEEQARHRAEPTGLDKGREAALAALEMARLFASPEGSP